MAILVFGADSESLGRLGELRCSVCNEIRPFTAAARYSYLQVAMLGVAGLVRYFITCPACGTTWLLDRSQARAYRSEGLLVPPDMPPLRKFGLLAAAVLFGAIFTLNRYGPLVTAGAVVAVASVFILPSVIRGVKKKGFKSYTREAVSADRPVSLFESVGGLPPGRAQKAVGHVKCPACGLNNLLGEAVCERCGIALLSVARPGKVSAAGP